MSTPNEQPAGNPGAAQPPAGPAGATVIVQQPAAPSQPAQQTQPPAGPAPVTAADVEKVMQNLLDKRAAGDPTKLSRMLVKQNLTLAGQLKDAEAKAKAAADKLAATLPDGSVALPKADADLLAAYRALGTPEEIRGRNERLTAAESQVTAAARERAYAGVVEVTEWDRAVVEDLARAKGVEFIEAEEPGKDGAKVKTYKAKGAFGDKGGVKEISLLELASGPWLPYREALLKAHLNPQNGNPRANQYARPRLTASPQQFNRPASGNGRPLAAGAYRASDEPSAVPFQPQGDAVELANRALASMAGGI